jgi:hypothetical protein
VQRATAKDGAAGTGGASGKAAVWAKAWVRGKLVRRNGKNKIAIELEDIGHSALVEISVNDVTPVKAE